MRAATCSRGPWLALALVWMIHWPMEGRADDSYRAPDCGTNSLYLLMKLNGMGTSLEDLTSALSLRRGEGYSMLELRQAAARRGLDLEGSRLTRENVPLDRPVIAHFGGTHDRLGHYAVLVPVGETGTMVQFVDPPYHPKIVDYATLIPAGSTLEVLYPPRFWEAHRRRAAGIGAVVLTVFAFLLARRRKLTILPA